MCLSLETTVLPECLSLSHETTGFLALTHSLGIILTHATFANKQRHPVIFATANWPQFRFPILLKRVYPAISSQICQFQTAWIQSPCLSLEWPRWATSSLVWNPHPLSSSLAFSYSTLLNCTVYPILLFQIAAPFSRPISGLRSLRFWKSILESLLCSIPKPTVKVNEWIIH